MSIILEGKSYNVTIHFTGMPGQLDYDSSNMDLILHDGATEGGIRFLNSDNADALYQTKSEDLDGLTHFEPQERGFLARRAPGDWRIRWLTVNEDNITLTEGQGYEGNPLFTLAETIKSAHSWEGIQTHEGKIVANGGINGNLAGDVTGNLTGNTAGIHTGSLNSVDGDLTLGNEQVQYEWLELFVQQSLVPPGCVIMWTGATNLIPIGWRLCNGQNGTPDLRDRFIVGAGGQLAVGNSGGNDPIQPEITLSGGAHDHGGTTASATTLIALNYDTDSGYAGGGTQVAVAAGHNGDPPSLNDPGHMHGINITASGAHTHTATVGEFAAIPPYYALCYIMKTNVPDIPA